jgi:hypothetical protein
MATQDLVRTELHPDSFAESSLNHPLEFWGPPLAPTETFDGDDNSLRQALGPAKRDERFFQPLEKNVFFQPLEENDFAEAGASFGPHRNLIAGSIIVAALGITALAYIWASPGGKLATQSEQSAPPVQSSQASPQPSPQTASSKPLQSSQAPPQPSHQAASSTPDPSGTVAWPDLPASITVDTSKVAPTAPSKTDSLHPTVSSSQKPDTVFLQRPGVNIRSTPSTNAGVVGNPPKGMRFRVTNREGDWMQVESDQFRGWIKSQFLAANKPR